MKHELHYVKATLVVLWKWLQLQLLLTSDANCHCEAVAHNIVEGFYFF